MLLLVCQTTINDLPSPSTYTTTTPDGLGISRPLKRLGHAFRSENCITHLIHAGVKRLGGVVLGEGLIYFRRSMEMICSHGDHLGWSWERAED